MNNIVCNDLEKIIKIKNNFENQLIDSSIIFPEYIEAINTFYETELENQDKKIEQLKLDIDKLYDNMQDIISKLKNKEQ